MNEYVSLKPGIGKDICSPHSIQHGTPNQGNKAKTKKKKKKPPYLQMK